MAGCGVKIMSCWCTVVLFPVPTLLSAHGESLGTRLCQVFTLVTAHTHCLSVILHTISSHPALFFDLQNVEEKEEELPVLKSEDIGRVVEGGGGGRGEGGGEGKGEGGGEEGGEGGGRGKGEGGGEKAGGRGGEQRRGGRQGMRRALSRGGRVEEEEGESFDLDQIDTEPTTAHKTSGMTSALCV